ncbi:MAG: PIG-L family deacetylase [Candidatus Promineifilaceae bacterium]|nr:PIG-L family deacetylase [Candidatus Promineifilaceae bacterium]
MTQRKLLAVFAHPDDESFGPGGTLAKYAAEGVDVHVAIATDGAAGSVAEGYEGVREQLADVRKEELAAAASVLGVEVHMLGYRDSGYIDDPANEHPEAFINVDQEEAVGRIVRLIRELRPHVVLTHDETGGYYHPDHIRTHEITTAAFHAAGDPDRYPEIGPSPYRPQRLYYSVIPNRWLKFYTLIMRLRGEDPTRGGRNEDIDLTQLGRSRDELHASINIYRYWERKQEAGAQHQSQGGGTSMSRLLPRWLEKRLFSTEYFIRAYPPPQEDAWDRDLFAGMNGQK